MLNERRRRTLAREERERLELLSAAIDCAGDGIIIMEMDAADFESREIAYVNKALCKNTGFTANEFYAAKTAYILHGPKTDQETVANFRNDLLAGRPCRTELELYRKDGSTYWAQIHGQPIASQAENRVRWIIVERDITKRVERERDLESERDLLMDLVDRSRELFQSLDGPSLLDAFTRSLEGLFAARVKRIDASGLAPASHAGEPETTFLVPAGLGCGTIALQIEGGATAFSSPQRRYALQLIAQAFHAAARNVALYQEVQERRGALTETNQLKNDLIAMLGHDFRGPLTSILGFAQLLQKDREADSHSQFALRSIAESARRLDELASDTLALARLERNELELTLAPLDLRALIEDIARSFRDTRTVEVQCDHPRTPTTGDAARLRQVFANLIDNAVKFSPRGPPVTVRIDSGTRGATVEVTDCGIGIPPEEVEAIFGRFTRGTNARRAGIRGTGFGLFLVRSIVAQHGGTIDAASKNGSTTFTVTLPHGASARHAASRLILFDPAGEAASSTALELRHHGYAVGVYHTPLSFEAALDTVAFDAALVESERLEPADLKRIRAACKRRDKNLVVVEKPLLSADLMSSLEKALRAGNA